jgi:hypothetical protein
MQQETERQLWLWAIYEHPKDYPGKYVVRRCVVVPEGPRHALIPDLVCDTLEEARGGMPPGLFNLGRKEADDPVIVETWI